MRYLNEFRDPHLAQQLLTRIQREADPRRNYQLLEFCGGHTHAICRHGIADVLPENVRLLHGPGCPVCVLPGERLQAAIDLAVGAPLTLCSYGDLLRVPGAGGDTLFKARARGADVRMVYAIDDALHLARAQPGWPVVFFAIGFETTAPSTAVALLRAQREGLGNFSVYCNHVLTPPALRALLAGADDGAARIDGFIGPAHVSTIIGSQPYAFVATEYRRPLVIAGFEPLDVLQAILMLLRQCNAGVARVENEYSRVVNPLGNRKAQALLAEVFGTRAHFAWRGLGELPESALAIRAGFAAWDAERRFDLSGTAAVAEVGACQCPAVLRGQRQPQDCPLFARACTPDHPLGACMVSAEGACAAHYQYGRARSVRA